MIVSACTLSEMTEYNNIKGHCGTCPVQTPVMGGGGGGPWTLHRPVFSRDVRSRPFLCVLVLGLKQSCRLLDTHSL